MVGYSMAHLMSDGLIVGVIWIVIGINGFRKM